MKVLLVNPAHPQTFWSFETVIEMLGKKALLPPLGLLTVAALLPRDWDLKLVDLTFQEISPQDWDECDLAMVSGMIVQHQGILETIREGKRRAKTVVVGGAWAFHFPEDALAAGADLVVKGEGEVALPLLLKSLERKEFGKVIRAAGAARMDASPAPRYDLIDPNNYMNLALQFSRGCPFQCEFCDITLMFGRRVRTKTPRQFLKELQLLYDTGWRGPIFVVDDNFIGNPGRAKVLLKELVPWQSSRGHPFEFYTQASVNLAWDQELLELMVQAGFTSVFLGIETTDEESLRLAGKTQNVGVDLDLVCQTINRAGLVIQAGCILGFDQERPGADQRLLDFARRNQLPEILISLLQAGPGTDLWRRLEKEGRLLSSDYEHFSNQTGLINFVPTRPLAQIVEEFIHLYQVLYEPGYYLERSLAHFSSMGPLKITKPFSWPRLFEVRAVLLFLFRQGIRSPWRWKFWKILVTALWRIPEKLHHFISICIKLEHYFQYRQTIAAELRGQLARLDRERVFPGKGS